MLRLPQRSPSRLRKEVLVLLVRQTAGGWDVEPRPSCPQRGSQSRVSSVTDQADVLLKLSDREELWADGSGKRVPE